VKDDSTQSSWKKTAYSNLVRYVASGTYFIRARVNGKLIRESLETDVLSVAKLKMDDRLKVLRGQAKVTRAGKMTFAQAAEAYKASVASDTDLKPASKSYRTDVLKSIVRTWPGVEAREVIKITEEDCEEWSERYAAEYSATRFNGAIQTLRAVFNLGIKRGAIAHNPAGKLEQKTVKKKNLTLPSHDQFLKILEIMNARNYLSPGSGDLVRLLAYSGMRKSEAQNLEWTDVDFEKGRIYVKGDPETGTKNGERRTVPMIEDLRELLSRIHTVGATGRVIPLNECRYSLETACKLAGCSRITHHDLRHLFATRCIEAGVDIPTVSRWLGHKDGGKLAMLTYGHLRDDHSVAMAQKVTFSSKPLPK
jgi:integrase